MQEVKIHTPDEMVEALDEYREREGFTSRSEAGRELLRVHLRERGYWPPEAEVEQ